DFTGVYNRDNQITLEEAILIKFNDIQLKIDSPESLIAHKLTLNTHYDYEDAYAVYIKQKPRLNIKTLEKHCKRLNVTEKLKELISLEKETSTNT
ncbi:MAG: hypothetical protein ACXAC7_18575, partial [Candidatus Hodarchaeales archaeon]